MDKNQVVIIYTVLPGPAQQALPRPDQRDWVSALNQVCYLAQQKYTPTLLCTQIFYATVLLSVYIYVHFMCIWSLFSNHISA